MNIASFGSGLKKRSVRHFLSICNCLGVGWCFEDINLHVEQTNFYLEIGHAEWIQKRQILHSFQIGRNFLFKFQKILSKNFFLLGQTSGLFFARIFFYI